MSNCRFWKATLLVPLLVGLLVQFTGSTPRNSATREILKSNRKENGVPVSPEEKTGDTQVGKLCQTPDIGSIITPVISKIITIPTTLISIIGNLTSSLGDLFGGGGGGGFLGISLDLNKTASGGGISPCKLIDPLLLANIPGIFIGVPLVLLGIAIIIGIIAAIVIAIGGLGGHITKNAYDMKNSEESGTSGYAPSVMPVYGTPVSSYGSPANVGSSYSRLADNVDSATQDFNQAYDKYSALSSQSYQQPQPQQQQQSSSSYQSSYSVVDKPTNQYDDLWNTNQVLKNRKLK